MSSHQQKLGRFFGKQNGSSAAPQQSKLSFSNSHRSASKGAPKHDDPHKEQNIRDESPDDAQKDFHHKRSASEASESPDIDDEPPVKRQRTKTSSDAKADPSDSRGETSKQASTETKRKTVAFSEETEDSSSSIKRKGTPKKRDIKSAPEPEDDDEVEPRNSSSPRGPDHSRFKEATTHESEADSLDEEEEPAAKTKTRQKLQTTLVSPINDPFPDWTVGHPVPYAALCTTFSKIEMTTKRLEKDAHCTRFLRQVLRLTPSDLLPTVLLMINKLAADYVGIELGIGESLIMKAIGETTGRTLNVIKADQQEIGDLGLVAAKSRSNQPTMFKPKALTVRAVHSGLMGIATIEGQGSQGRKVAEIKKLLSAADTNLAGKSVDINKDKGGPSESKFIIRSLEGKTRIGLADKSLIVALAHAIVAHEHERQSKKPPTADQITEAERTLKTVYNELPSYEVIVPALLEHGLENLHESCKLQPGVPLKPMLARPTKSITEVLDRFEGKEFSCEYKYDGERAQIHFVAHDALQQFATPGPAQGKTEKGVSNIFSRNSEDLSKKYPDILAKLPTWIKSTTKSFVLDCETVAWDVAQKKVLPFQQLMTRKRKDVKAEDVKVKVCVFAFDLLYLNGEPLVTLSFRERRDRLHEAFQAVEGEFAFAEYSNTSELDTIQTLLDESVKASCEGLMVKMLDGVESHYEPSRRSQNWLKVKKDYLSGVGDSLDLVVLGAYYGKGKRTSWYGAFLLACYNTSKEQYETVCNIGTGFSEAILEELHKQLSPIVIDRPKPFYSHSQGKNDQPDVWFEPRYVWEVKTADLTLSPRYKAAIDEVEGQKGVSLRFPRFLKVRDDKKPEEATSSKSVADMYRSQEGISKNKGTGVDDDFEY